MITLPNRHKPSTERLQRFARRIVDGTVWDPLNANPFAVGIPCEPKKIVDDVASIDIIHIADKPVREPVQSAELFRRCARCG